jgi:hypothetical protein
MSTYLGTNRGRGRLSLGSVSNVTNGKWTSGNEVLSIYNDNLVAAWLLASTADSKKSNTLTNQNTVTFSEGIGGRNAANFVSASSQHFTASDSNDFFMADVNWTVCGFFKVTNFTGNPYDELALWSQGNAAGDEAWDCSIQGSTVISINENSSSTRHILCNLGVSLSAGVWYHYAISRNGTSCLGYLNAVPVSVTQTTAPTGIFGNLTNGFSIGKINYTPAPRYFYGSMQNLMFFKGIALSQKAITALYNSGQGAFWVG